jgi:hypothetical protein
MKVEPEMRHLSAEEFIAKTMREPRPWEEHPKLLLPLNPPAEREAQV